MTRNAPGGTGATIADLPVAGSSTPTPASATNAISPCARAPSTGDGERCTEAAGALLQAVARAAAAIRDASLGTGRESYRHVLPQR